MRVASLLPSSSFLGSFSLSVERGPRRIPALTVAQVSASGLRNHRRLRRVLQLLSPRRPTGRWLLWGRSVATKQAGSALRGLPERPDARRALPSSTAEALQGPRRRWGGWITLQVTCGTCPTALLALQWGLTSPPLPPPLPLHPCLTAFCCPALLPCAAVGPQLTPQALSHVGAAAGVPP